jgi:hypothetical protein
MEVNEAAAEIMQMLEDEFPEYLAITGMTDHPVTRLMWTNCMLAMFKEIPAGNTLVQALVMKSLRAEQKLRIQDVRDYVLRRLNQ